MSDKAFVDTNVFLYLYSKVLSIIQKTDSNSGDYTEERQTVLDNNSVDVITERIRQRKLQGEN